MSEKDAKAKEFLADNERFADLFNYYLFNGREIIKPEKLEAHDTEELCRSMGQTGRKDKNRGGVIYESMLL